MTFDSPFLRALYYSIICFFSLCDFSNFFLYSYFFRFSYSFSRYFFSRYYSSFFFFISSIFRLVYSNYFFFLYAYYFSFWMRDCSLALLASSSSFLRYANSSTLDLSYLSLRSFLYFSYLALSNSYCFSLSFFSFYYSRFDAYSPIVVFNCLLKLSLFLSSIYLNLLSSSYCSFLLFTIGF